MAARSRPSAAPDVEEGDTATYERKKVGASADRDSDGDAEREREPSGDEQARTAFAQRKGEEQEGCGDDEHHGHQRVRPVPRDEVLAVPRLSFEQDGEASRPSGRPEDQEEGGQ